MPQNVGGFGRAGRTAAGYGEKPAPVSCELPRRPTMSSSQPSTAPEPHTPTNIHGLDNVLMGGFVHAGFDVRSSASPVNG